MIREQKLDLLRNKKDIIVHIAAPSDVSLPGLARNLWGDNWVKVELSSAFRSLGYRVSVSRPDVNPPDVLIHLYGGEIEYIFGKRIEQFSNNIFKIAWVYSHPEKASSTSLRGYDRIYCCSTFFVEKLRQMGYAAQVMLGATSKRPVSVPNKYDLVFVGNNRGPHGMDGRAIIDHLKSLGNLPFKVGIWGNNWPGKIPASWYGGRYWPYETLNELYASSKVCLQDHRPEMVNEGFVSVKIFDILASGSLPISDANKGIDPIFKGAVPQYQSAQHLKQLLDRYIKDSKERERLIKLGQKTAFACTWEKRAALFVKELRG